MNNFPLEGMALLASITFVVGLLALAGWVTFRYKSVGVFGLAAVAILPISHLGWWYDRMDTWTLWVSAPLVIGIFIAGMLVDKKIDDFFHVVAAACSLALPGLIGFATIGVNLDTVPLIVVVIPVIPFAIWAFKVWKSRKQPAPTNS